MKNIAVFGGSFNPPTLAHIQVVKEIEKLENITQVILLPSGEREDKKQQLSVVHRKNIMEISQKILKKLGINTTLDTHFLEGKNGGHTTTKQEEEYFRQKLGFSPYFVYGTDVTSEMPTWSGNDNSFIERKLKKIFIPRPGYKFDSKKHGLENFILLDIPDMLDISSSMAKQMIINKQSIDNILPPEIIAYIEENNLYQ